MAAGSGGRADAPAPGVLGFSCLEPRIPQHMLFPLLLPQASLSCLRWRKTALSTLLASDSGHPTHPWLHAHLGIVPGAPLWTASARRPRH